MSFDGTCLLKEIPKEAVALEVGLCRWRVPLSAAYHSQGWVDASLRLNLRCKAAQRDDEDKGIAPLNATAPGEAGGERNCRR